MPARWNLSKQYYRRQTLGLARNLCLGVFSVCVGTPDRRVFAQGFSAGHTGHASNLQRSRGAITVPAKLLLLALLVVVTATVAWFLLPNDAALESTAGTRHQAPVIDNYHEFTNGQVTGYDGGNDVPLANQPESQASPAGGLSYAYGHADTSVDVPTLTATIVERRLPWQNVTIENGDTLSGVFARLNVPAKDWMAVLALGGHTDEFTKLRPGEQLSMALQPEPVEIAADAEPNEAAEEKPLNRLLGIRRQYSESYTIEVIKKAEQFVAYQLHHPPEIREVFASGVINNSLSQDANDAGVPVSVIMKMADIFAWDIDFAMDIRKGDEFAVVYQEVWSQGEMVRTGQVLATQFVNRGKVKEAVYFAGVDGYSGHFTPDGNSLRKAFLRSPLKFSRISSHFNLGRRHPILNTIRAHKGVDYAARRGTPINAAGDGRVTFAGWKGGYGRTLVIKHHGGIETLYAHLNGFAEGVKVGARVTQGQRVAFVGSTGLATGPHLHYEFRQNGQHRDPLKVALPRSIPLPEEYQAEFKIASKRLITRLHQLGGQQSQQETTAPVAE